MVRTIILGLALLPVAYYLWRESRITYANGRWQTYRFWFRNWLYELRHGGIRATRIYRPKDPPQ
jgi:hypothetical protein